MALVTIFNVISFAQTSNNIWTDSAKVPAKRMAQYKEFMDNQTPYPAKPRDQIEIGASLGYAALFSDIDPRFGYGGSIYARKALSHTWSIRAAYTGMMTYGLDWKASKVSDLPNNGAGTPWAAYASTKQGIYYANYKNKTHAASIDFVYSLNTLDFYRGNPKWNIYVFGGYTLLAADVDVNALDSHGNPYKITDNPTDTAGGYTYINPERRRSDIKQDLKNLFDKTYESNAPTHYQNRNTITRINNNWLLRHAVDFGGGVSYKLNKKVNIGFEEKFIDAFDDELDGVMGDATKKTNDIYYYTSFHISYNVGKSSKRVEPLWWINPNNYVYSELNKPSHIKFPKPVLPDADGDGVTDQFDLEPNTPAGAQVDTHGRALDTDGDGVPDYRDKEKLTPQNCFPVDADGVGKCPEPVCKCKVDSVVAVPTTCTLTALPSIQFKSGAKLSKEAEELLSATAEKIKASPICKVKVIGHPAADKVSQQLTWERVNAIIKYLVEKQNIAESRFIFTYDGGNGDQNTIDLQGTMEDGPNTVPAPHPNLRSKN